VKRALLLALALLLTLLLNSCDYPKSVTEIPHQTVTAQTTPLRQTPVTTEAPAIHIKKDIYAENDVTVSVDYIGDEQKVAISIINERNIDLYYNITGVSVNRCMVYDLLFSNTIGSGKTAIVNYDISGAKDYGVDTVEELGFGIWLYDSELQFDEKTIEFVDVTEKQKFNYSVPGYCFYDDDECAAFLVAPSNRFSSFNMVYYNKTSDNLSAYMTDVSVNGIMIDQTQLFGYFYILPNCYAYTGVSDGTITFYSALDDEIEEKGLEIVEELAGKLGVWGTKDYVTSEILVYPES
jgi:hypothetical protein